MCVILAEWVVQFVYLGVARPSDEEAHMPALVVDKSSACVARRRAAGGGA